MEQFTKADLQLVVVGNTKLSSSSDRDLWLLDIAGSSKGVATVLLMPCQVPASLQKGQFATSMHHVLQFAAWRVKPHRFQFVLTSRAVNCDILAADVRLGWGRCALPAPCPWLSKLRSWEEKQPTSLFVPLRNGGCRSRSCSELLVLHSVYYWLRSRSWSCRRRALAFTALSTWGPPSLLYR